MHLSRIVAMSASVVFAPAAFGDCEHGEPRSGEVEAAGARTVIVRGLAGDLIVAGRQDAKLVRVTGTACAESQKALASIQLEVRREGDAVHVQAIIPGKESYRRNRSLDMKVEVPSNAVIEIRDSSGDIEVSQVASAAIEDRSGDVSVRDVAKDVKIKDRSGDIEIAAVRGDVELRDSSGDVNVKDVAGDVKVPVDSSGRLTIRRVRGGVHIRTDSSGDIVISDVNGNVRIGNDSSGDIRVTDVGGDFTVEHDSTGRISQRNVLGAVHIPDEDD